MYNPSKHIVDTIYVIYYMYNTYRCECVRVCVYIKTKGACRELTNCGLEFRWQYLNKSFVASRIIITTDSHHTHAHRHSTLAVKAELLNSHSHSMFVTCDTVVCVCVRCDWFIRSFTTFSLVCHFLVLSFTSCFALQYVHSFCIPFRWILFTAAVFRIWMVFYIWNMHIYMTNDTLKVKEPENESTIWIKSRGFVIISRKSQKMDVECDEKVGRREKKR